MRDRDQIILEDLYFLVLEGRRETSNQLKNILGDDEEPLITKILDVIPSGNKNDGIRLGKYIKMGANPDEVLSLAEIFYFLKTRKNIRASQTDLNVYRKFSDFKDFVEPLKNKLIKSLVTSKSDREKLEEADKTDGKYDSYSLAKFYNTMEPTDSIENIIGDYESYLEIRDTLPNVPRLSSFPNYTDFHIYISQNRLKEDNLSVKRDLQSEAIYEDDLIKVWRPDNVRQSIEYANALYGPHSWCTGYPLNKVGGMANQYFNYRLNQGSTFYYVRVKPYKDVTNGNGFISIEARPQDTYEYTPAQNGAPNRLSWEEVLRLVPDLKAKPKGQVKPQEPIYSDYKDVFKHLPLSNEEVNKFNLFRELDSDFSLARFNDLKDDEKKEYISLGFAINSDIWDHLDEAQKNAYVSAGQKIDPKIYDILDNEQKSLFRSTRVNYLATIADDINRNWRSIINDLDIKIMLRSSNKEIFPKILKNPRLTEIVLDYVTTRGDLEENDPRIKKLILASPKRCFDYIIGKLRENTPLDQIDTIYFDAVKNDPSYTNQILRNIKNFDNLPDSFMGLIIGDLDNPRSGSESVALNYFKWYIDQNKNLDEINPGIIKRIEKTGSNNVVKELLDYLIKNNRKDREVVTKPWFPAKFRILLKQARIANKVQP